MKIPRDRKRILIAVLTFGLWLLLTAGYSLQADHSITLKYTYRPDQTQILLLNDSQGKVYLPLTDVAKFYGIDLKFDAQSRRIILSKGKSQVELVLSQPMFLISNPTESFPTDPAEVVSGQLGITPTTAQDLLAAILGIDVQFQSDQQAIVVGGVKPEELKTEIVAQEKHEELLPAPTATPEASLVAGPRGEEEVAAIPLANPPRERTQGYHVDRIVIDPGHGGRDIGAKGYDNRYCEKQATLSIATKVVLLLQKRPDLTIFMTRNKDYFVTLKGRTQFANKHNADLFVSIHCNSTPRNRVHNASGTEIYVYSPKASNHFADFEAANETMDSEKIPFIDQLSYEPYKSRSILLAEKIWRYIQKNLGQHMRKVQQKNFYVLARVDMPSILIETAFISNPKEEFELEDPAWQDKMAKSIADGILAFKEVAEGSTDGQ